MRRRLSRLVRLWDASGRIERLLFLGLVADEAVSALSGRTAPGPMPASSPLAPATLVDLVEERGWSLRQIASAVGVSSRSLRRWWSGQTKPRPRHLARLEALLAAPNEERSVWRPAARSSSLDPPGVPAGA